MSSIGVFGEVPFECSSEVVRTFRDLSISRSARWATHEVIGQKPVLEYVGPSLDSVSFSVRLAKHLGAVPEVEIKRLKEILEGHLPQRLLIGSEYFGKFVLESFSEERIHHGNLGVCTVAEVSLTLKEVA